MCRDPNTIFRGNSLTSKCIDETMKLAGMHYLQVTLKPIIDEVWHCNITIVLFFSVFVSSKASSSSKLNHLTFLSLSHI